MAECPLLVLSSMIQGNSGCTSDKYIKTPTGNQAMDRRLCASLKTRFPTVLAIDGSHIPIIPPHDSPTDYYNRKGFHSIVLQELVDHPYRFFKVYVGLPGSVHSARIFSNSAVYFKGEARALVPAHVRTICGVPVPVVIFGDPAYSLLPWLMKVYPGVDLSAKHSKFSRRLSRACVVVECAVGRFEGLLEIVAEEE